MALAVKIFAATLDDVPRIMDCARVFVHTRMSSPVNAGAPHDQLNEAHYGECWRGFLKTGIGAMFLLEDGGELVGGIGGVAHPDLVTGELTAVELYWYVKPEYRRGTMPIRLLTEFEQWAARRGCRTVAMIHMQDSMPEALGAFYERRGYKLYETMYRKSLL
jgi:GNAT superfamily N-acetyltransferase